MRRLKPRGKIPVAGIDYTGELAKEGNLLSYTVCGRGKFPTDMLRYDSVGSAQGPVDSRELREITIQGARRVTPMRWASFGWRVLDDIVERPAIL